VHHHVKVEPTLVFVGFATGAAGIFPCRLMDSFVNLELGTELEGRTTSRDFALERTILSVHFCVVVSLELRREFLSKRKDNITQ